MVNSILNWLHTVSTSFLAYYAMHAKLGSVTMAGINILSRYKGRLVQDDLASYFRYGPEHVLCNAHLLTLLFLLERYPQKWVQELSDLLMTIKEALQTTSSVRQLIIIRKEYDNLVVQRIRANPQHHEESSKPGQRGRLEQIPARNLLFQMRDHKEADLAFMVDFNVPFDNHQAIQDLLMMRVKQKYLWWLSLTFGRTELLSDPWLPCCI